MAPKKETKGKGEAAGAKGGGGKGGKGAKGSAGGGSEDKGKEKTAAAPKGGTAVKVSLLACSIKGLSFAISTLASESACYQQLRIVQWNWNLP
jgi:hypothetical protein